MAFPVKNAFAALVDQVRADRVFRAVEGFIKRLLFRQKDHSAVVSWRVWRCVAISVNCVDYVAPHVRCVVAVQVDYLLHVTLTRKLVRVAIFICLSIHFILVEICRLISCGILRWLTMVGDLVQIVLVSLRSNNVDHLMKRHFWVLLRVGC